MVQSVTHSSLTYWAPSPCQAQIWGTEAEHSLHSHEEDTVTLSERLASLWHSLLTAPPQAVVVPPARKLPSGGGA